MKPIVTGSLETGLVQVASFVGAAEPPTAAKAPAGPAAGEEPCAISGWLSENVPLTSLPVAVGGRVGDRQGRVTGGGDHGGRGLGRVVLADARRERAERGRRAHRQRERRRHGAADVAVAEAADRGLRSWSGRSPTSRVSVTVPPAAASRLGDVDRDLDRARRT